MSNEEIEKFYKETAPFMAAVSQAKRKLSWGEQTTITCPLCKRNFTVKRSSYNGHVHAQCECGMAMFE